MAPSIVGESLKGAELVAEVMQNKLGLPCNPPPGSHRTDIIQAVQCGTRKKVIQNFTDLFQKVLWSRIHDIDNFEYVCYRAVD